MEQPGQAVNFSQPTSQSFTEQPIAVDKTAIPTISNGSDASMGSPQSTIRYAGFWIRFVASWADGIIVALIIVIVTFIFLFALKLSTDNIFFKVSGMLVSWVYAIVMLSKYQATIGKRLMGLTVISDKSETLTVGQIIFRETIGKILSSAITIGIGFIMTGFTERKQALHDKVAGTLVIYKDPNAKTSIGLIIGVIVTALIMGVVITATFFSGVLFAGLRDSGGKAHDASIAPVQPLSEKDQSDTNQSTTSSSTMTANKDVSQTSTPKQASDATSSYDDFIKFHIGRAAMFIEVDHGEKGTYAGASLAAFTGKREVITTINKPDCNSQMKLDVSPDGKSYVLHQPLCSDAAQSWCIEHENSTAPVKVYTEVVTRTYRCQ